MVAALLRDTASIFKFKSKRAEFCFAALMGFCGFIFSDIAFACCDIEHTYSVKGITANDTLNIRQLPSPKAKITGKIPAKIKPEITIVESSHVETIECVSKPTLDAEVNVFKEEDNAIFARFGTIMKKAPIGNDLPNQSWCRIKYKNTIGWVNAKYLNYACSQEISETGTKGVCKPISWATFSSKMNEYVLSFAGDSDLNCRQVDAKIIKKIGKDTVCKKVEWDVSGKKPIIYHHCLWNRMTVYVSNSKESCLQLKTLLQAD